MLAETGELRKIITILQNTINAPAATAMGNAGHTVRNVAGTLPGHSDPRYPFDAGSA